MSALQFRKKKRTRKRSKRWFGQAPRKEGWTDAREAFVLARCEHCAAETVEGKKEGETLIVRYTGHVDHIVPERMILQLCPGMNPHDPINLMCLARSCHGIKTSADRHLCRGDKLRFLQILGERNWPMGRVHTALKFYGF